MMVYRDLLYLRNILHLTGGMMNPILESIGAAAVRISQLEAAIAERDATIERLRSEVDAAEKAQKEVTTPAPSAEIVITRPAYVTSAPCLDITCTSDDARAWLESVAPTYGQLIAPLSKFNAYRLIVSTAYNVDDVERFLKAQGKP